MSTTTKAIRQTGLTLQGLIPVSREELELLRDAPYERGLSTTGRRKKIAKTLIARDLLVAHPDMLTMSKILHVRCTERGLTVSKPLLPTASARMLREIKRMIDQGNYSSAHGILSLLMERILIEYMLDELVPGLKFHRLLHNVLAMREYYRERTFEAVKEIEIARPAIMQAVKKELEQIGVVQKAYEKHFPNG